MEDTNKDRFKEWNAEAASSLGVIVALHKIPLDFIVIPSFFKEFGEAYQAYIIRKSYTLEERATILLENKPKLAAIEERSKRFFAEENPSIAPINFDYPDEY